MRADLFISLAAESDWDLQAGKCVRILFGTFELACIPVGDRVLLEDDDVSRIAGEWLAKRIGLEP